MQIFWNGFKKKASSTSGTGKGFGSTGKGFIPLGGADEVNEQNSTQEGYGSAGGEDTRTDKTLLDRERNPRDFSPFETGREFFDEATHVRY